LPPDQPGAGTAAELLGVGVLVLFGGPLLAVAFTGWLRLWRVGEVCQDGTDGKGWRRTTGGQSEPEWHSGVAVADTRFPALSNQIAWGNRL